MTDPREDDAFVDALLSDLAHTPVRAPSDALMARVLADAQDMLPPPGGAVAAPPLWRQLVDSVGGWGTVGGLVAAAATGFAVGLGGLDSVGVGAPWSLTYDTYYDSPGTLDAFGWDMEEG